MNKIEDVIKDFPFQLILGSASPRRQELLKSLGFELFNKPLNFAEGKKMLETLSGKMHEVFTAVCLKSANKQTTFYDVSKVYFKKLKPEEIEYYLTNYSPYDKAGGYGVQDWIGYIGIDKIEGSFYNVMGLPVKQLYEELIKF